MSKPPDLPPTKEGELHITSTRIDLVKNPRIVDIEVTLYEGMKLPGRSGLELQWVKRAVWLQVPIENMWMMVEGAQVPLTTVVPARNV
jgi:hypothetical protein